MLSKTNIFIDSTKTNGAELQKYILQKRNPRFLGLPLGLYIHNLGNHDKPKTPIEWANENKSSYNFVKRIFSKKQSIAYANSFINLNKWFLSYDEPAIVSELKVKRTVDNLSAYYKTQGYFKSSVTSSIKRDSASKKATVTYRIQKGKPTILDTINIDIKSPVLDSIYTNSGVNSLLVSGDRYKDQTFRNEASKVVKLFRNNGIYNFTESALGFYVDSTRTDYKTNVDFLISSNRLEEKEGVYIEKPYKVQTIKEVNVITDYSFTQKEENISDTVTYKGIKFSAYDKLLYNPKYLSQSIFLKPGEIYSDTLANLTRTHLKSLQNFKSTNIQFIPIDGSDIELRMDVLLSPLEKYTLGLESELTHSNIRNLGVSGKFSITDRNIFRGAELLKMSFLGSWFNSNNGPGWEIGADASLEIPRFVAPFGLGKFVPKEMSPRTLFSIGSSFQKNIGLDRQTFTILTDYKWQYTPKKTIQLEVLNTQYIQNLNVSSFFNIYSSEFDNLNTVAKAFDLAKNTNDNFPLDDKNISAQSADALRFMDLVSKDPNFQNSNPTEYNTAVNILDRYNIITSDFLIPTLAYTYTYNGQTNFKNSNFSFFRIRLANSGNILGLLSDARNENDKKTILNIPLAQYFKTDIEFKKFWSIGSNNAVFAFRTFLGAILTYDNSDVPFTKSYFAGGSNDIRAWQTYELGPGSRNSGLEFNIGDFKFLTSAEYRFDVVGSLKGALFIDAGNIWDISGSEFVEDDAKFTGLSSLKNIAIGSGFGARYDFNFLVIRLDVGFKTYEPYLEDSKWFKNYNFNSAVFNIGINYPF
jgi:outer membrane translocation and assembly module TamA